MRRLGDVTRLSLAVEACPEDVNAHGVRGRWRVEPEGEAVLGGEEHAGSSACVSGLLLV